MAIAFWSAGVPGRADTVKVEAPSAIAVGISASGFRRLEHGAGHRREDEGDEPADAAMDHGRAGRHDRWAGSAPAVRS